MDESKGRTVTELPKPGSINEMQRFLGFTNFYCFTTYLNDKSENESAAVEQHCQPRILMLESLRKTSEVVIAGVLIETGVFNQ